jgi:hypothetical protein
MGFLARLNGAQGRAVDHATGPSLVLACAVSGKAQAFTHRIAQLVGPRAAHYTPCCSGSPSSLALPAAATGCPG